MKRWIVILIFAISMNGLSQPYFSKMFNPYGALESFNSLIEDKGNSYIMEGHFFNPKDPNFADSLKYEEVFIANIDSQLNFKTKLIFGIKGFDSYFNLLFKTNTNKYLVMNRRDSLDQFSFLMYGLNDDYSDKELFRPVLL